MRNILLISVMLLSACASSTNNSIPQNTLQPYFTETATNTDTPRVIIPETALPTATPITYVIQPGDTLSQLAEKFSISQDDLRAANPDINPNSLSIGATILIPSSSSQISASTLTPIPVPITQTICHPTADNGLWCFALIQNNTGQILENVSAQISVVDKNGSVVASQTGSLPLDILSPTSSLPVYVFFPNISADLTPQVQLLTAFQTDDNGTRYLSASLNNTLAQIASNGLTAQLSGQIFLPAESQAATQVWVTAVAYDKTGQVIGVKRWEGGAIQPGTSIQFNFEIASIGSKIDSVEFAVEARP